MLVDGALALYLERGGKSALAFTDDEAALAAAARDLVATARARHLATLTIEQVNGVFVYGTAVGRALRDAGFVESPRGLTLRRTLRTCGLDAACGSRRVPEGDTVFRTARRLDEVLAGAEVTRFELRVPQAATVDLRGMTVHGVVSRGKHLLHRIGDWTLHSHLKMEGAWHVYAAGERWRKPGYTARAIVGTAEWDTVGFDLADIEVVPTRDEEQLVGHLGPDPLGATGIPPRPRGGSPPTTGPSTSPCWTSATSPGSATSTRTRSCSCAASCPRLRPRRRTPRPSSISAPA